MKRREFIKAAGEIAADPRDTAAITARERLQVALDQLNPAGDILDNGNATGRHTNRKKQE